MPMKGIREHVENFLIPVDPHGALIAYAARLLRSAEADAEVRKSLRAIAAWRDEFVDKLAADGLIGPAEQALAPVAYLHAVESLRTGARHLTDVKESVQRAVQVLTKLEPDFGTELLAQAEQRAYRDPHLAARFAEARGRFFDLAKRLEPIEKRLCRLIDASEVPANTPGASQTGDIVFVATPPGPDRCRDHLSVGACVAIVVVLVVVSVAVGAAK